MEGKNIDRDNNNIEPPKKKSHWLIKTIILTGLISAIGAVVYYAAKDKLPSIDGVFTTYKPLPYDTTGLGLSDTVMMTITNEEIVEPDKLDEEVDDMTHRSVGPADSTSFVEADILDTVNNDQTINALIVNDIPESNSLFKINTSFKKIDGPPISKNEISNKNIVNTDLFSDLLLYDVADKAAVDKVFSKNGVSYQSILKLIAIAGQDIIISDDVKTSEMMLDAIAESDNISDIYIIDRNGNVAYTTHKPKISSSRLKMMAKLNLDVNRVKVTELDGHFHISLPIYHTYGKVGIAVLSIK